MDPLSQFDEWFIDATQVGEVQPEAMALSTLSKDSIPASRMVLLKARYDRSFSFFTNYTSKKAVELRAHPFASLLFFWPKLQRQVRIEGTAEVVSDRESDEYWKTRPRLSQIAALSSHQSETISSFEALRMNFNREENKWQGKEILRPTFWGGFAVVAERIEFWQGRPHRLHERTKYIWTQEEWIVKMLSP